MRDAETEHRDSSTHSTTSPQNMQVKLQESSAGGPSATKLRPRKFFCAFFFALFSRFYRREGEGRKSDAATRAGPPLGPGMPAPHDEGGFRFRALIVLAKPLTAANPERKGTCLQRKRKVSWQHWVQQSSWVRSRLLEAHNRRGGSTAATFRPPVRQLRWCTILVAESSSCTEE